MRPPVACANHPDQPAELDCRPCGALLCRACGRTLRDKKTVECLRCGALLLPILIADPPPVRGPVSRAPQRLDSARPLVERLPLTWEFLLRPSVLLTLAGTAVLQWVASWLGLVMALIVACVTTALFFHIVESTANGAEELDAPDFTEPWADLVSPLLRMLATMLPLFVAFALGGVPFLDAILTGSRSWIGALGPAIALVAVWLFLWPLLILVAAISRSIVSTLDPRVWVRVLREMRLDYLIAAAVFYAALAIEVFLVQPFVFRLVAWIPVPVVLPILAHFIVLLPFAWRARILGEAARPYLDPP